MIGSFLNSRYSLIFFGVLLTSFAFAQQPEAKLYTLEEAVRTAMQKNPDLTAARLEVERADARVLEAWGYALPALDLSGQYSRALKKPVFFLPDFQNPNSGRIVPIEIGSNHSVNMSLTARQTLFNSTVIIGIGAARVYSDAAREIFRAKELETVTKVRKAYYGVLMAGEAHRMMQSTFKNAQENLRNVQLLRKQGLLSEYDELRATVGVENLQPAVIQSENGYALAMDGLRGAMGSDPSEPIEVDGKLTFQPVDESMIAHATEAVLQANPHLRAMRLQVDVNKAFVNAERSNYFPTLAAFGNYQYQVAKNSLNISTGDFIASSTVGLSLTMSLFQGLQTNARVEQAQLETRKSQEQLVGFETNIRTAVHSIVLQLQQSKKRVEAQARTVEQAERGYKIATTRFLSGSGTQLEVNDAQLALNQAQVNRFQAVYDYLIASADFDQVLGRLPAYASKNID